MNNFKSLPYRPGLCCISLDLNDQGYKYRTMRLSSFEKNLKEIGIPATFDKLDEIYKHNTSVMYRHIYHCERVGWNYRLSNIFPLADLMYSPVATRDSEWIWYQMMKHKIPNTNSARLEDFYDLYLDKKLPSNFPVRLSTHPDQYCVLASESDSVRSNSQKIVVFDDVFISRISNDSYQGIINVHVGTSKGDPREIFTRFDDSRKSLFLSRNILAVENEDKGFWNVQNLYDYFYQKSGIPITFDYLHHKCNPGDLTEEEAIRICHSTWPKDIKPIFHYSESIPSDKNPRKHADIPTSRPNTYGLEFDLDYEFKHKDRAIMLA